MCCNKNNRASVSRDAFCELNNQHFKRVVQYCSYVPVHHNAPFRKFLNSAQSGRFALIL